MQAETPQRTQFIYETCNNGLGECSGQRGLSDSTDLPKQKNKTDKWQPQEPTEIPNSFMLSGIHVNKLSKAESPEKVERVYLPKTV